MTNEQWLRRHLEEKNIEGVLEPIKVLGVVHIGLHIENIIDGIVLQEEYLPKIVQTFREIDFNNGDTMHYFKHLARAVIASGTLRS